MSLQTKSAAARISKLERALECEACKARAELTEYLRELDEVARGGPPKIGGRGAVRCEWCGARVTFTYEVGDDEFAHALERMDALFWQGRMCAPEYDEARALAYGDAARERFARYGDRAGEVEEALEAYKRRLEAIRQPPTPYLCRVPGCRCAFPKMLAEARANARAKGFRSAA